MKHDIEKSIKRYRHIISGGFGLILIVVITVGVLLLESHRDTLNEFEETILEHNLKVEFASEAETAVHMRAELTQLMALEKDPFERDKIFLEFNKTSRRVNIALDKLKQLANSDDERKILNQQDQVIKGMVEVHRVINNLLMDEQTDEAAKVILDAYSEGRLNALLTTLQTMRLLQKKMSETHLQDSRDKLKMSAKLSAIVMVIVVVSGLFLAFIFWRYASNESTIVARLVNELSASNKHHEHLSLHDNLTKLPNRAHFFRYANEAQERKVSGDRKLYFLYMDIDGFKPVNDGFGHEVGNELLQKIAQRLQESLSAGDFVARLGGDEFVVVTERNKIDVERFAQELLEAICSPFTLSVGEVTIGTSIGIADSEGVSDVDEQVHLADVAMYQSKGEGGCSYSFSMNLPAHESRTINSNLFRSTERENN